MSKKLPGIILLLAAALMLVAGVVPHHHHGDAVCLDTGQCPLAQECAQHDDACSDDHTPPDKPSACSGDIDFFRISSPGGAKCAHSHSHDHGSCTDLPIDIVSATTIPDPGYYILSYLYANGDVICKSSFIISAGPLRAPPAV